MSNLVLHMLPCMVQITSQFFTHKSLLQDEPILCYPVANHSNFYLFSVWLSLCLWSDHWRGRWRRWAWPKVHQPAPSPSQCEGTGTQDAGSLIYAPAIPTCQTVKMLNTFSCILSSPAIIRYIDGRVRERKPCETVKFPNGTIVR
jgi:hypothetical protein